jgi:hypothetical protein
MAEEAEKIAEMGTGRPERQVVVEEPGLADSLWASLQSFVFGGALAIVFLLFLLIYGERSLQKLFIFSTFVEPLCSATARRISLRVPMRSGE